MNPTLVITLCLMGILFMMSPFVFLILTAVGVFDNVFDQLDKL